MKQLAFVTLICAVSYVALATVVSSEESDSLEVKVSPQLVLAVRIPESSSLVQFGDLLLSDANDSRTTGQSDVLEVWNDGATEVSLLIEGTDAEPSDSQHSTWTLDCTNQPNGLVGEHRYVLRFAPTMNPDWAQDGMALCTAPGNTFVQSIGSGGQVQFRLQVAMPTETTGYSERSSTVTITAVE